MVSIDYLAKKFEKCLGSWLKKQIDRLIDWLIDWSNESASHCKLTCYDISLTAADWKKSEVVTISVLSLYNVFLQTYSKNGCHLIILLYASKLKE